MAVTAFAVMESFVVFMVFGVCLNLKGGEFYFSIKNLSFIINKVEVIFISPLSSGEGPGVRPKKIPPGLPEGSLNIDLD